MIKLAKLVQRVESYYRNALKKLSQVQFADPGEWKPGMPYVSPDGDDESVDSNVSDLFSQSERFDIKNEELYNLFETFMGTYEEAMDLANHTNPQQASYENLSEIAQLLQTLEVRAKRIVESPHLNPSNKDYEEDFDPADLIDFIQKVMVDAQTKANALSEDFDAVKENQINNIMQEEVQEKAEVGGGTQEDKEIDWSGNKKENAKKYQAAHREKMKFIRKTNPIEFTKYREMRQRQYQEMMSDPEKREAYRTKAKQRFAKWYDPIKKSTRDLQAQLLITRDPKKKQELREAIRRKLEEISPAELAKRDKHTQKRTQKITGQAGELSKSIEKLRIRIDSQLYEMGESLLPKLRVLAANDPIFIPYKDAVTAATDRLEAAKKQGNVTPDLELAQKQATLAERKAIKTYLQTHPDFLAMKQELSEFASFRKTADFINQSGPDKIDETAPVAASLIGEGMDLVKKYGHRPAFKVALTHVANIIKELKSMIGEI